MAGAKIMVLYPTPRDPAAFERAYRDEHTPMVTPSAFPGMTRFVASRITGTTSPFPPPTATPSTRCPKRCVTSACRATSR